MNHFPVNIGLYKYILLVSFLTLLTLILPKDIHAAMQTSLSLTPATNTYTVGQIFTIDVTINTATSSALSTDLSLTYNSTILQVTAITPGSFLTNAQEAIKRVDNTTGTIHYGIYTTSVSDAGKGTGVIAHINVTALNNGSSALAFDTANTLVYGIGEGNILSTTQNATYAVNSAPQVIQSGGSSGGGGGNGGGGGGGSSGGGGGGSSSGGNNGRGDLNGDGKVNIFDLSMLLRNFGRGGQGDINASGRVDIFDLSILLRNFGR